MKVTLLRSYGAQKVQRLVDLDVLMDRMKCDKKNGNKCVEWINFAVALRKGEEGQVISEYNGLVLLQVPNLVIEGETDRVISIVTQFPQTRAAFVGSDGVSVNILVAFTLPDGGLPQITEDVELFHAHAYQWAVKLYQPQIPYSIELVKPTLQQCCPFAYDAEIYFAPLSQPLFQDQPTQMPEWGFCREMMIKQTAPVKAVLPGYSPLQAHAILFETALNEVLSKNNVEGEDVKPLLVALATNCFKSGVPQEDVVKGAMLYFGLVKREVEVRQTIENVYGLSKGFGGKPTISSEQLLAITTDEFMNRRYEFRYNTQTTEVEYRERNSFMFDFKAVDNRAMNSIALNAQMEGIQLWDRDVTRYVYSDRVPLFSPIDSFLSELPVWDGVERINLLADAVPCTNTYWHNLFHRWFLCMVAHWRGLDKKHANSTSPLLVGAQGYGKSTFCLNILPPALRTYYTDSIDFSRKRDAEMALNRFGLIGLDEFDQISESQQAYLKHILQKPVVCTRKPNKSTVQELRRYASFIATSNHEDLLTDPSGSRRFICIQVTGKIADTSNSDYDQLYAQALYEIQHGERYWFDADEEALLMKKNQEFEVLPPAEQLFMQYYHAPKKGEKAQKLLAAEIFTQLQKKSGMKLTATKIVHFGRILKKLNIPSKKANNGTYYSVVES